MSSAAVTRPTPRYVPCAFCPPGMDAPPSDHLRDLLAELAIRNGRPDPRLDPRWAARVALAVARISTAQARYHTDYLVLPPKQFVGRVREQRTDWIITSLIDGRREYATAHGSRDPFGPWTPEGAAAFLTRDRRVVVEPIDWPDAG